MKNSKENSNKKKPPKFKVKLMKSLNGSNLTQKPKLLNSKLNKKN